MYALALTKYAEKEKKNVHIKQGNIKLECLYTIKTQSTSRLHNEMIMSPPYMYMAFTTVTYLCIYVIKSMTCLNLCLI